MRSRRTSTLTRRAFAGAVAAAPMAAARALAARDVGRLGGGSHEFTLLYTNDFHSAFEPIPAYWLRGSPRLGGAAHLATLVEQERASAGTAFLLDSGDMFTGTLSRLTEGEALLEMMTLMRYDAMGVGNHEFDYGWQAFERGITRVPFPTLCCNVRYRGHHVRFCRPSTMLERNGVAPRHRRRDGPRRRPQDHHAVQGGRARVHRPGRRGDGLREGPSRHRRHDRRPRAPGPARPDADRRRGRSRRAAGARPGPGVLRRRPGHRRLHRRPLASRPRAADRASRHEDADHADVRLRHAARSHPAAPCATGAWCDTTSSC